MSGLNGQRYGLKVAILGVQISLLGHGTDIVFIYLLGLATTLFGLLLE